jgi:hypothetical protein
MFCKAAVSTEDGGKKEASVVRAWTEQVLGPRESLGCYLKVATPPVCCVVEELRIFNPCQLERDRDAAGPTASLILRTLEGKSHRGSHLPPARRPKQDERRCEQRRFRVRISSFADAPRRTPLLRAPPRKLQGAVADRPMGKWGTFVFHLLNLPAPVLRIGSGRNFGKGVALLVLFLFFLLRRVLFFL